MYKTVEVPKAFEKHLVGLAQNGPYRTLVKIPQSSNTPRFCYLFLDFLEARLPATPKHHVFWWCTSEGVSVAVSGDRVIQESFLQYVQHSLSRGIVESADVLYSGRSLKEFVLTHLTPAIEKFVRVKGRKSFSGTLQKKGV